MHEGQQTGVRNQFIRWAVLLPTVLLVLTGCGLKQKPAETPTDQTTTDPTTPTPDVSAPATDDLSTAAPADAQAGLDQNLTKAKAAAIAWQADATLHYASVDLPASLAPQSGNEVYVFGSAQDGTNWWTYSLSQSTGKFVRALIPKEDYLGTNLIPVNEKYWKMNYIEALQLADQNGGATFRSTNQGTRVTTFLSHREPKGWLWWTVEYKAPSGQLLTLLVNPNLGEVVDETGAAISTGGDTTATGTTSS